MQAYSWPGNISELQNVIERCNNMSESLRVNLYGRFTGEYVPEVEKALSGRGADTLKVVLDLSNVTFVDRAGMKFLCGAKSGNIAVENAPSYVKRWMGRIRR